MRFTFIFLSKDIYLLEKNINIGKLILINIEKIIKISILKL